MIVFRGMPTRQLSSINKHTTGRQGSYWRSPSVDYNGPSGVHAARVRTSEDPAVAFIYACNYAAVGGTGASVYAIDIKQGRYQGEIDARNRLQVTLGTNPGETKQQEPLVNQLEHLLPTISSRQIIGWFTVEDGNPYRLGNWNVQPHWQLFEFDRNEINKARSAIVNRINQKYPGGLCFNRHATEIASLTGFQPGVGF